MKKHVRVIVWPDGTWILADDHTEEEYRFMGDDFMEVYVDDEWTAEQIEEWLNNQVVKYFDFMD